MRKLVLLAVAGVIALAALPALAASGGTTADGLIEPAVVDGSSGDLLPPPVPLPPDPAPIKPYPIEPPVLVEPVEPVPVEPPVIGEPVEPVIPEPPVGALALEGDVRLSGAVVPSVLFSLFWDTADPGHVQLWALWNDEPVQICDGRVHDGPVYKGRTYLYPGTCVMTQTEGGGFYLFVLGDEGSWAYANLGPSSRVPPVDPAG